MSMLIFPFTLAKKTQFIFFIPENIVILRYLVYNKIRMLPDIFINNQH